MPEPLTIALVSVTVVSLGICAYKAVDRIVSAPKEVVQAGGESVEKVIKTFAAELKKLFGSEPRISVNRRVIQTGGTAVRELALFKEKILITEEWANTSWKSTKHLHVQQPFLLKAGFDLNRLKCDVDAERKQVTVTISDSTIVNLEYAGEYEILKEKHGFWNRISATERDAVLNSLPKKAQDEAEKLQLRAKAAEQLNLFLRSMLPPSFQLVLKSTDDTICFKEHGVLKSIPETTLSALGFIETPPIPDRS
jgi:Protein of unknown function (DUF4230)